MAKTRTSPEKPVPDIAVPSQYDKESWTEEWQNKPVSDDARRLQFDALNVIDANQRDAIQLNRAKRAQQAAYSYYEGLAKTKAFSNEVLNRIFDRSSEFEKKAQRLQSEKMSFINGEIEKHGTTRQAEKIQDHLHWDLKSSTERTKFLRDAIAQRDAETVSAALAWKPFISGLSPEEQGEIRAEFVQVFFPEEQAAIEHASMLQNHVGQGFKAFQGNLNDVVSSREFKEADELMAQAKNATKFDE